MTLWLSTVICCISAQGTVMVQPPRLRSVRPLKADSDSQKQKLLLSIFWHL